MFQIHHRNSWPLKAFEYFDHTGDGKASLESIRRMVFLASASRELGSSSCENFSGVPLEMGVDKERR
jgi:hypothetical protein